MSTKEKGSHPFFVAMQRVGATLDAIAEVLDCAKSTVCRSVQRPIDTESGVRNKQKLCRQGLMVWLLDRGYDEDFVWQYNDSRMFPETGLPEPDMATVMREVRQHLAEYQARARKKTGETEEVA